MSTKKEVIVECGEIGNLQQAFLAVEKALKISRSSITDMDSLYDVLLEISEPMELTFEDMDLLEVYLGEDGELLLETFERAAAENENLELI